MAEIPVEFYMGLREKLNERPQVSAGVVVGVVLALIALILYEMFGGGPSKHMSGGELYFSADDGQTWFADSADKPTSTDHNGAEAYRCFVFKTSTSAPFAGYLEKLTPPPPPPATGGPVGPAVPDPYTTDFVKKPGDKQWVPKMSPQGQKIVDVHAPGGSAEVPQLVVP